MAWKWVGDLCPEISWVFTTAPGAFSRAGSVLTYRIFITGGKTTSFYSLVSLYASLRKHYTSLPRHWGHMYTTAWKPTSFISLSQPFSCTPFSAWKAVPKAPCANPKSLSWGIRQPSCSMSPFLWVSGRDNYSPIPLGVCRSKRLNDRTASKRSPGTGSC